MPPATHAVPVIACPECGALEPGGYLGERSGEVVVANRSHFSDNAGFLYCVECGAVWGRTFTLPTELDEQAGQGNHADVVQRGKTWFAPKESLDPSTFRRLKRQNLKALPQDARKHRRLAERVYDAEALCAILDLPPAVTHAVTHHLTVLTERADTREILRRVIRQGKARMVRSEACTIATVMLVMERFRIAREDALLTLVSALSFSKAPHHVTPDEYEAAFAGLSEWYASHLWRDGRAPTTP